MDENIEVYQGFSLVNRWLLYTSVMLAPAQFISGIGSRCPSSMGFLAYNYYTQVQWYIAIRRHELHALSLLLPHFNLVFLLSYLGGVSAGILPVGIPLGLGTAGVLILNTICSWKSWAFNMPDGYGVYRFFFFGWRTLTPKWHKFMMVWQIADSMFAAGAVLAAIAIPIILGTADERPAWWNTYGRKLPWWSTYAMIVPGALLMLFLEFPLILWTELIVKKNHIKSETDEIAVILFGAQIAAMILPMLGSLFSCVRGRVPWKRSIPWRNPFKSKDDGDNGQQLAQMQVTTKGNGASPV